EEYKRPKFEVNFDPAKGSYQLNEKVTTTGSAMTFSGAPLDGAKVKYTINRRASFPYWCWYRYGYTPGSSSRQIKTGTSTTDNKGQFEINFEATPDKNVSGKFSPTFSYTISADVTDINGETHSSTTTINVGYTSLNLAVYIPEMLSKTDADSGRISSTNLNGEFEPAQGEIKIWSLARPGTYYKKRIWEKVDYQLIPKAKHDKLFPFDEYADESNFIKWKKKSLVLDQRFDTKTNQKLSFTNLYDWEVGNYVMEAKSTDKFGNTVSDIRYFVVYDKTATKNPTNNAFQVITIKSKAEPGEAVSLLISAACTDALVRYDLEHKEKIIKTEWITLSESQQLITIPILEEYRGGITAHFSMVKHEREYVEKINIIVPYTNKQLDIKFETFRNKLFPGQQEKWKLTISGTTGDKVAAEMVATLYDASLDEFRANNWYLNLNTLNYSQINWTRTACFGINAAQFRRYHTGDYTSVIQPTYPMINWYGYHYRRGGYGNFKYKTLGQRAGDVFYNIVAEDASACVAMSANATTTDIDDRGVSANQGGTKNDSYSWHDSLDKSEEVMEESGTYTVSLTGKKDNNLGKVKARTNFNETAFFYPHLMTNEKGEIVVEFTIPEALTKWKFMGLAHSKDLKTGTILEEAITQKDLMIYPNSPRFFREKDTMYLSTKIVNLANNAIEGTAQVFFYDALTMQPIENITQSNSGTTFKAGKKQSTTVGWEVVIPHGVSAITYKVVAQAGQFSDGEETVIPVLTNRMLVTESIPLAIRSRETKTFVLDKLATTNSTTRTNYKLTLEFSSNPAWYAVQSLPYLMEYPYECAEQTFSRYFANTLASHVANSSPKIKTVFESWKSYNSNEFLSNLEKNQELKSAMLEETPWLIEAKNEGERKKQLGLLFDLNKMGNEQKSALSKLQKMQLYNGAWPWFTGMRENRYITQHIVMGMGHLKQLDVADIKNDRDTWNMIRKAVNYLDDEITKDYKRLLKSEVNLEMDHLGTIQIQYLYTRSFFTKGFKIQYNNSEAYNYYLNQAKKYWLGNNNYMQAMIALALYRETGPTTGIHVHHQIINSLKENSITNNELGMYWITNGAAYSWHQAPIETQALLIEAFDEIANDRKSVDEMKIWLLKQKQTQNWASTKATTEACYALLLRGANWLSTNQQVDIEIGGEKFSPYDSPEVKVEGGTGYFKKSWNGTEVSSKLATVKVSKATDGIAWGGLYWQYFEDLDKITAHDTPLSIEKKLFVERVTEKGKSLKPITADSKLLPGDKIIVRIELKTDRDMEYVHLKDMRAAGLEPIDAISGYRYQGGLGYYQSTKDASTNFFFDRIGKGTYIFEYPLRANITGDYSNGVTSIQCMYAPEFSSHSQGVRISIKR
ncbi:MAG: alpha-2-macroglobulin, partial [Flavobacteriales bacterium]|nr:alpha-2-macroglobulin [Flavobacteriales bacterium]